MIKPDSYRKKDRGLTFLVFFTENENYIKGLNGYVIMKSDDDAQGAIALIFWISKSTWISTTA